MFKLIKNEWIKVKSEKVILVIVVLSLIPLLMNFANFAINNKDISLDSGLYLASKKCMKWHLKMHATCRLQLLLY
ncbi:hypothetical protein JOC94_004685 [Bacillus thermophilus]|uniref:Uncharacterized protein n=1 Tax=Siminovitchia thermophila TaxID=1245522 RepID=A0ABS2REP5_9BACI|nr:hypothetical protein [Siminovitchia thermophila]